MFKPLLDLIYPIGSYYITDTENDPAEMFGGSWGKLPQSKYLTTAGDTDVIGRTDIGNNSPTIERANLPNEKLTVDSHFHTLDSNGSAAMVDNHAHGNTFGIGKDGAHSHNIASFMRIAYLHTSGSNNLKFATTTDSTTKSANYTTAGSGEVVVSTNSSHTHTLSGGVSSGGGHSHSLSGRTAGATTTINTSVLGSGETFNVRPSSVPVYIWRRNS